MTCACGREARYKTTGECARCYKRRYRAENPHIVERERAAARAWKDRNRERNRARDREYAKRGRVPCDCGNTRLPDQDHCGLCEQKRVAHEKRQAVERMWHDGLLMREIADRMGWTMQHIRAEVGRMRDFGYDLPHRYRGHDAALRPRAVAMYAHGMSSERVADTLGVAAVSVLRWARDAGVEIRHRGFQRAA